MDKKLISIVITAYNEEECIDHLYKALIEVIDSITKYNFEVIIVDNGSYDDTYAKLLALHQKDKRFKIVKLTRNCQADGGITAGLRFAKGDAAIITYADLDDPPSLFNEFIKKWEEGYKHVYGIIKRRNCGFLRNINSKIFYYIIGKLTKNMIPKNASDFRLVDKKVYQEINNISEKTRFLRALFAWTNFKSIGIDYNRNDKRAGGHSKAYTLDVIALALKSIFSYSNFPLKLASIIGGVTSVISFGSLIYFAIAHFGLSNSQFKGFEVIICAMLFLFSILFLLIGILGEYLALIYTEIKSRPLYIVEETIGFNSKEKS